MMYNVVYCGYMLTFLYEFLPSSVEGNDVSISSRVTSQGNGRLRSVKPRIKHEVHYCVFVGKISLKEGSNSMDSLNVLYRQKFSPILPPAIIGEIFLSANFLSCVNDYIEDMATFTTLAKIYSTEYFCNTKVSGLGETFV